MSISTVAEIDFIEELRLRRWARENYVTIDQRDPSWHPIIQEEMSRKDQETGAGHRHRERVNAAS